MHFFAYLAQLNFTLSPGFGSLHLEEHVDEAAHQLGGLGLGHEPQEMSDLLNQIGHLFGFAFLAQFLAELQDVGLLITQDFFTRGLSNICKQKESPIRHLAREFQRRKMLCLPLPFNEIFNQILRLTRIGYWNKFR